MQNCNIAFLQNIIFIALSGGHYEILIQKFEFGPEDFLAYVGGYLVSNMRKMFYELITDISFHI